jgi:hypothetical protein
MSASIQHLDNDGATPITGYAWPIARAGLAQTARKFGLENNGDRELGGSGSGLILTMTKIGVNDGLDFFRCALDTATISRPYGVAAVVGGSDGVWGAPTTAYYEITAINATGQTVGSEEVTAVVDVATKKVTLTWTQVVGATGYKVYRTEVEGVYTTPALRATIGAGATVTYVDDGGALSAGAPPAANTTGGAAPNYGTVPTLDTDPLIFGALAEGQQEFYWINRVVPDGTSEAGNTRLMLRQFAESL